MIGQLVSEIFMSESVNRRTDRQTPARVPSYKLTESLWLGWAKNIMYLCVLTLPKMFRPVTRNTLIFYLTLGLTLFAIL